MVEKNNIPNNIPLKEEEVLGVDVNIGENLFALSDGTFIYHEPKVIGQALRFLEYIKKKTNDRTDLGKMAQKRKNNIIGRMKGHAERKAKDLVSYAIENGYRHIVMEDMIYFQSFGKIHEESSNPHPASHLLITATKMADMIGDSHKATSEIVVLPSSHSQHSKRKASPNELAEFMGIGQMKDLVCRIARKYGITVSFVDPHFTSKTCPKCGYIHKENRQKEDIHKFRCMHCGYEGQADYVASINIKNRIIKPYLRNQMEYFDPKREMFIGIKRDDFGFYKKIYENICHVDDSK